MRTYFVPNPVLDTRAIAENTMNMALNIHEASSLMGETDIKHILT